MSKLLDIKEAAKLLNVATKHLFSFLRSNGYLTSKNLPYNRHLAAGLFEIQHTPWTHPKNGERYSSKTLLTAKGVQQIAIRLRTEEAERLRLRNSLPSNDPRTTEGIKRSTKRTSGTDEETLTKHLPKTEQQTIMSQITPSIIHSWKKNRLNAVILDVESTGLGTKDEAIEISIIDSKGCVLFDSVLHPTVEITPESTKIHGITSEEVEHAPSFAEVYHRIHNICHQRNIITYNADFDRRILDQTCKSQDLIPVSEWACTWFCAMESYASFKKVLRSNGRDYRWHKLEDAAAQLGIDTKDTLHRALPDTKLTLQVIQQAYEELTKREAAANNQDQLNNYISEMTGETA